MYVRSLKRFERSHNLKQHSCCPPKPEPEGTKHSNNVEKYETLIVGLEVDIPQLEVYEGLELIMNQLQGECVVRRPELIHHHDP
ncbi:hypothetical protein LIER_22101 [Lithospermum erythrorhizon]|uniref:Uncharacterized protein n=1 Tax=Lithospermum erythrorhizon TaxID=34254 RepID=A0AAV3QSL7_LITER